MNFSGSKNRATLRRSRELKFQHSDVIEKIDFQRRDVGRDVPERYVFNVTTLKSNVVTL